MVVSIATTETPSFAAFTNNSSSSFVATILFFRSSALHTVSSAKNEVFPTLMASCNLALFNWIYIMLSKNLFGVGILYVQY